LCKNYQIKILPKRKISIFLSPVPVFENCDDDILLIKKYNIDNNQYEKSRFCWLLKLHFDSLKQNQGVKL